MSAWLLGTRGPVIVRMMTYPLLILPPSGRRIQHPWAVLPREENAGRAVPVTSSGSGDVRSGFSPGWGPGRTLTSTELSTSEDANPTQTVVPGPASSSATYPGAKSGRKSGHQHSPEWSGSSAGYIQMGGLGDSARADRH